MVEIKPYIIVPNLIEQATWGGDYIANLKKISSLLPTGKKLGQSYELYRDTYLSRRTSTEDAPTLELADPSDPTSPERVMAIDDPLHISTLIQESAEAVLGTKARSVHGDSIEVLIKLNHAKGNSYQVHAKEKSSDSRWLPKPESWYYLEPGLVSLGIKEGIDWEEYRHACELIEKEAKLISSTVINGDITLDQGRTRLQKLIEKHNPKDFVNIVSVAKNTAIDLSACGIHHSWEQNPKTHPQGNVVYEVQKNVYDPDCTIRGFDKGKIKDDGTIREIHVDDYFQHLDHSAEANNPDSHYTKGEVLKRRSTYTVKSIFGTENYNLRQLSFNQKVSNQYTTTKDSYHHLFVRDGSIKLGHQETELILTTGFSAFIPASTKQYSLKPYKSKSAVVLQTYV